MLQFSVDNYGFLADHALPQYFTIIISIIIIIIYNLVDLICTFLYLHLNMSREVVAEFTT